MRSGISVIGTSREKASLSETVELNTNIASLHPTELTLKTNRSELEQLTNEGLVPNILVNNAK